MKCCSTLYNRLPTVLITACVGICMLTIIERNSSHLSCLIFHWTHWSPLTNFCGYCQHFSVRNWGPLRWAPLTLLFIWPLPEPSVAWRLPMQVVGSYQLVQGPAKRQSCNLCWPPANLRCSINIHSKSNNPWIPELVSCQDVVDVNITRIPGC